MKNKDLVLKFNMEDWIRVLTQLNLKEIKLDEGLLPHEKKEFIEINQDRSIMADFLSDLKKKREDNKELISNARFNKSEYPFPELILLPKTSSGIINRAVNTVIEKLDNRDLYYNLLKNNNKINYQELVYRMSGENRRDNVVLDYDVFNNEDALLRIFQSAIEMSEPSGVQSAFEYFAEEYSKLDSSKNFKI